MAVVPGTVREFSFPTGETMSTGFEDTPTHGPRCGTAAPIPVVYGAPREEMRGAARREQSAQGGRGFANDHAHAHGKWPHPHAVTSVS